MTAQQIEMLADELARRFGYSGKEILTSEEAAALLGISQSHLYKLTMSRQIPHYKPQGKKCYFNRQELLEWVQQGRVAPEYEHWYGCHLTAPNSK